MNRSDKFYKNLTTLFTLFKNRPNHLAKYLSDNSAFSKEFIKKVESSKKLTYYSNSSKNNLTTPIAGTDINKMIEFYDSLIDELSAIENQNSDDLEIELNTKLDELIKKEKYEEASKIRDYMQKNGIKRKNNF